MGSSGRKYEKAWDNKLKKWVRPEEVRRAEAHDVLRYFSEQFELGEDKGCVLTLHKESKPFRLKTGTEVVRKAHFSAIADNTSEYRKQTSEKLSRQESLVHKLCKQEIKHINFIKIPEVKVNAFGTDYTLIPEQYIKIHKILTTEKLDRSVNKIPDVTILASILGKKQEISLEFYYSHAVDELKRRAYEDKRKNCLEVDISFLKDNLDASENDIKNKIRQAIENDFYWISCRAQQIIEKDLIVELSRVKGNLMNSSFKNKGDHEEWLACRLYAFKDTLNFPEGHPCHFTGNVNSTKDEKCIDIGKCKNCSNCAHISNYRADDTNDVKVYCRNFALDKYIEKENILAELVNETIKIL